MGTFQSVASDFLSRILRDKRAEVAERLHAEPEAALYARAEAMPPALPALSALRGSRLRVIAEVKRGSPSAGTFDARLDAAAQAAIYAGSGAAAVSVLTDAPYFQGSLDDLVAARNAVKVPVLRKDFIIDAYQIAEARAAGADLVLLIVAALDERTLRLLLGVTHRFGMTALVEVNTEDEARLATAVGASLVGINNRDLHTFHVDMQTTARLRPLFPAETVVASLSGIRSMEDARAMRTAGADAVLVGESLVRAPDPRLLLADLAAIS